MTNKRSCGQIVSKREKRGESVGESREGGLLMRHLFVSKMAAGIGSESGFVSVAKEKLLASIAIAGGKLDFW